MENNQPKRDEVVQSAKLMIQDWTKEQQQALYVWMHNALDCRVYEK